MQLRTINKLKTKDRDLGFNVNATQGSKKTLQHKAKSNDNYNHSSNEGV